MKSISFTKTVVAGAALAVVLAAGMLLVTTTGRAQGPGGPGLGGPGLGGPGPGGPGLGGPGPGGPGPGGPGPGGPGPGGPIDQEEVQIGLNIAPVHLNFIGKDRNLVGLGSFLVNAVGDCNGCHNGSPSGTTYTDAGNPYLLHVPQGPFTGKVQVDPQYYLAGGQDFGPLCPGVGGPDPGCAPHLITRNLTPDITGKPEGGHSLSDFLNIMQNGTDYDHIHPICGEKINGVTPTNFCVSAPPAGNTNGDVLQVMPWPVFRNMSTYELTAIWTYLSAIPCINNTWSAGPLADPTELNNTCPPK